MHEHPHRKARSDSDRRLDLKVPFDDALPRAIGIALRGFPQRPDQICLAAAERQLSADAEQGRQPNPTVLPRE